MQLPQSVLWEGQDSTMYLAAGMSEGVLLLHDIVNTRFEEEEEDTEKSTMQIPTCSNKELKVEVY